VEFIHKSTQLQELRDVLPTIEFNECYIEALNEKVKSKEEKAANLVFTLNRYVLVDRHKNAIYESVAMRVEKLLELWKQKTKNFEEIYSEGLSIWNEIMSIKKRQRRLNFSDIQYNLLLILENELGRKKELVDDVNVLYDKLDEQIGIKEKRFPNWSLQLTVRKNVEKTIRRFIRKYVKEYGIGLDKMEKIYQRLIDYIIKNA